MLIDHGRQSARDRLISFRTGSMRVARMPAQTKGAHVAIATPTANASTANQKHIKEDRFVPVFQDDTESGSTLSRVGAQSADECQ